MGRNKAFLNFPESAGDDPTRPADSDPVSATQTLLARSLSTLRQACDGVTILGDPAIFANYAPTVPDIFPDCGPLGAIHAALTHSSADLNLMLAVDMPFASVRLVRFLFEQAETTDAGITLPRTTRGPQPLCAVYRRDFLSTAELALRAGNFKIDAAFASVPVHIIDEQQLAAAGFSEKNFFNLNTPEEHRAATHLTHESDWPAS